MKGKNIIFSTAKKYVGKACRAVGKHSPTILIIAGSVGVVAGVVLAVKAGKESDIKTQKEKEDLEIVHNHKSMISDEPIINGETGEELPTTGYTKFDYTKDLTHAYMNLIFAYAKVYGPAALTTLFSLFLIFSSHRILNKRYGMAYAGLAAMTKAYDQYRRNVIDAEGLEADQRYRFGIKAVDELEPLLDKEGNPKLDKNGNPKQVKRSYDIINGTSLDPRSVLWDETTAAVRFDNKSPSEYERFLNNKNAVLNAQAAANNVLIHRADDPMYDGIGYLYLNEVLYRLGMKPVDMGWLVGWRYDPRLDITSDKFDATYKKPEDWGDNCVDFGLNNPEIPGYEGRQRFLAGHEEAVLLYMNWDGIIWDKIGYRVDPKHWR